ncbi:MAG: hypothetical protein HYV14_10160 [Elusimicrobia bacterium]|nr:hypothetical protein [Elusimicrobiota bacterium]
MLALNASWLGAISSYSRAAEWTATTALPDSIQGHALVYSSNRLFHTGGISYNGGILDGVKVYSASASDAGAVGAWTAGAPLPEAVYYHAGATVNGHLYVLGGFHYTDADGMVVSNVVYRSKIGSDGAAGAWQTTTALPEPVFFPSAAVWSGRIYITGGWNGSTLVNKVYSAEAREDGSLGPWVAQKSLPEAVYTHAAVSNGTLYVLGGTVNGGADIQNSVYFAKINADGTLDDWAATTPLPSPVSNHGAVVANGRVMVFGGWTGAAPTASVNAAAVEPAGGLAPWSAETPLPRPLYLLASAASPSHIFVSGGIDSVDTRGEVYSLPLPPAPAPLPPPPPTDALPPRTTIAFGSPFYGGAPFISPDTPASLAAVDDATAVGDGAGVGVASTQWAVDDGTFTAYTAPIRLTADGGHWIRFRSVDALGHAEDLRASSAAVDGTPPASALEVGSPKAVLSTGKVVVGPGTALAVSAADPVVNGAASGVAATLAAVDGGALAASSSSFVLPAADGAHEISMRSTDNVGNEESVRRETVYRDGTAPVTAIAFSAAPYASPSGPIYGAGLEIGFTASDPVSGGVAAGVHHTEFAFDGGASTKYAGPFGAAEGARTLSYRSVDSVANEEPSRVVAFQVDATPPMSSLSVSGGTTLFGEDLAASGSQISLSAEDPVSGGVASGVASLVYSVDGGADQAYAGPFSVGEGRHTVSFGAVDRAGNAEDRRTAAVSPGAFLTAALTGLDSVDLSGKAKVTGDVVGLTVTVNGQSSVTGTITRGAAAAPAYDLDAARAWAQADNDNAAIPAAYLKDGALALTGGSLELPEGDYYFTGLSLAGQSRLTVAGRVNVFLHGPLSVEGGAELNAEGAADGLWIVADAGDASVAGNARSAFNLFAPRSAVSVAGGGQFAGRVLARTVAVSGKAVQPSTTGLPPSTHAPKGPSTRAPRAAREGKGTAGGGHAGGRDEEVASSTLERRAPRKETSGPVQPAPSSLSSAVPEVRSARATRVKSSMPALALSARAAFSSVGREAHAVRSKDRTAVVFPEGAVTSPVGVTVSTPKTSDLIETRRRASVESRKGLVAASAGVQYGPEGTRFAKPVTLELPYDRAALPKGVSESDLAVHYWNPVLGDWEKLDSSVDARDQIVRAQTTHFSLYQVFGGGSPASAPSGPNDPTFAVHAGYAFPNPSRGGAPVVIRVQPGLADSVSVRVYDLSGRMVHESSNFTNRGGVDDGNGFGSQFTFEHVWDVAGVGSGVYNFVVTGRKAGASDIKATGKVGVIK